VSDTLIDATALARWLGYERDGDIARWLRTRNIPFWYGKDRRPCTTQAAIDSMLLGEGKGETEEIQFKGYRS